MEKRVRIIDCETTGFDPEEDRLVEIAAVDWVDGFFEPARSTLVNPGIPIPPTASAVHHITDRMVADAPSPEEALRAFDGELIYCAHNSRFDRGFLPFHAHWICTYRVALNLWPDAPGFSNQVLRYFLKLEDPPEDLGPPHRAAHDAWVTSRIFAFALETLSAARMIEISSRPALLPSFTFGKHAGQPIAEIPRSYLSWILSKGDEFDEDVLHTARMHLEGTA